MRQHKISVGVTVAMAACFVVLPGCARKHRRTARVPPAPHAPATAGSSSPNSSGAAGPPKLSSIPTGYFEEGIASWYGIPYHGRPAADGEIYNMETLVAAHRLLPFDTWLRVTNLANQKTVDVRVIDRGPFVEGRIIDLSKAAARQIDLLGPGIGRVRLEVISSPLVSSSADLYAVQIGAFSVQENAERLRAQYARRFGSAQLTVKQGKVPLWRVLVGREPSVAAAQQLLVVLGAQASNVFVVRLDRNPQLPRSSSQTAESTPATAALSDTSVDPPRQSPDLVAPK